MGFIMLMVVLALGLIGAIVAITLQFARSREVGSRRANRALAEANQTLEDVKNIAYEHMALDSSLSHIIIDRINEHKRKELS